jgi:branched-chain amino acid transport system permease protein
MSSASITRADGTSASFTQGSLYRFLIFPIGQILVFILAATLIMTVISYILAALAPIPEVGFPPVERLTRQLPGTMIAGISIGFVYSMIALGYTLVYGVLKFINFAHSEIFMIGGVVAFEVTTRINEAKTLAEWHPVALVLVVLLSAMLVCGLLAVLIERVAYRPLRSAPRLVPLITAIGVSFLLTDAVRAIMAVTRNIFNLNFPTGSLDWLKPIKLEFGENTVNLRATYVIIVLVAMVMLVALNYFVNGTRIGRGIRAVSQDPVMAGLAGINVNRMITITFFLGGALGGAAGAMYGLNAGAITPYVGFIPGLKAFTAAVLGGIGNVTGALLGGLTLGIAEQFLNGVLPFYPAIGIRYTDIFVFGILILILIFRPGGLLGEQVDEKV